MAWFPATKLSIGNWEYLSVKMTFGDFFDDNRDRKNDLITFAKDLTADDEMPSVLDDWLQRKLNGGRAKKEIARYLLDRSDAFFSSVVIACLGEPPVFEAMIPPPDQLSKMGLLDKRDQGYINFDRTQKYFVLDGQHRLYAIRSILEDDELKEEMAPGFLDQGLNVLLVNKGINEDPNDFKEKYRRLFTSLNRYAKSTNKETNIIMDEDDVFAILTRRMVQESSIFKFSGPPNLNPHIDIEKKNIARGESYLTSLATLYDVNSFILKHQAILEKNPDFGNKNYVMHRPSDADLDEYYAMLNGIWNALVFHFPDLVDEEKRRQMRSPNAPLSDSEQMDHLFLRPKPQIDIMAPIIRDLIEKNDIIDYDYKEALKPLTKLDWDLRKVPFVNLILVNNPKKLGEINYVMTEGAAPVGERMKAALDIVYFLLDDKDKYNSRAITRLKSASIGKASLRTPQDEKDWWDEILALKESIQDL